MPIRVVLPSLHGVFAHKTGPMLATNPTAAYCSAMNLELPALAHPG